MTASTADTSEPSGPADFVVRRVGVVGLGHMGNAFAVNLVEDGHQVTVFDRDPKRAAALTGARAASGLADLAACDVVVTSLPGDDALAEVTLGPGGLAAILSPKAVHISTSTVSPEISRRVAKEHAVYHQDYVAAPVLEIRTSRANGSSSYWPRAYPRRSRRSVHCSSVSVSGSS
jgi:3-hydroxyisobutyrate dehydrogenase-like beta-hydroxyacid dehydrogenase